MVQPFPRLSSSPQAYWNISKDVLKLFTLTKKRRNISPPTRAELLSISLAVECGVGLPWSCHDENPPAPKVLGRDLPDGTRKRLQVYLGGGGIFRPKPPVFDRS